VDLSAALARHVATDSFEDLPSAAVAGTTRSLLDALGVTLAARIADAGAALDASTDVGPDLLALLGP
jgi:2-methylcitrate dehydratase PrpD